MFEDRTYENLMTEWLALAPKGTDVRQGSIFYDAIASIGFGIARFYADLQTIFDLVNLITAVGEYLDRKGLEYGITRLAATSAAYEYIWTGDNEPAPGNRFFANELFFVLRQADDMKLYLEAEAPGVLGNNIIAGTNAVPVNNISGLSTSVFGALIEPGVDRERDDDYRSRILEKIANPSENGNRQHYKTWCESITGVGRARVIPLFARPNTVMAVLVGADGLPATQAVINRVQEYIDPVKLGLTVDAGGEVIPVGDGLGDGVANIGAHFAAVAATKYIVNISFSVQLSAGTTGEQIKSAASAAIVELFKGLSLNTPENQRIVIRVSALNALLFSLRGLVDYSNLTINGTAGNVELSEREIPLLGEVTIT